MFTESHEWLNIEEREAKIGITEYAQRKIGDIIYVELPETGEQFIQFDDYALLGSVNSLFEIYIPVTGLIQETNDMIISQPEIINSDPFESGWLAKIEIVDEQEIENLMDKMEYELYLETI